MDIGKVVKEGNRELPQWIPDKKQIPQQPPVRKEPAKKEPVPT